MHPINTATKTGPTPGQRRAAGRGFTLVEVMVATVLLSMIILGILQVLIGSYRVAAKARFNDHARYVIKSMADQFLTQQPFNTNDGSTLTLFQATVDASGNLMPLGTGLSWTNSDGSLGTVSADPLGQYFYVKLGDNSGAPITATVTRTVQYLYPNTGQETLVPQPTPPGYLLEGIFTITFPYPASSTTTQTQSITVVRSVP